MGVHIYLITCNLFAYMHTYIGTINTSCRSKVNSITHCQGLKFQGLRPLMARDPEP